MEVIVSPRGMCVMDSGTAPMEKTNTTVVSPSLFQDVNVKGKFPNNPYDTDVEHSRL